jgi:hypothetical protein
MSQSAISKESQPAEAPTDQPEIQCDDFNYETQQSIELVAGTIVVGAAVVTGSIVLQQGKIIGLVEKETLTKANFKQIRDKPIAFESLVYPGQLNFHPWLLAAGNLRNFEIIEELARQALPRGLKSTECQLLCNIIPQDLDASEDLKYAQSSTYRLKDWF